MSSSGVHVSAKIEIMNLALLPVPYLGSLYTKGNPSQGCNARKVYCGCVYSAYILKPVLSGRNL